MSSFSEKLIQWYVLNKRELPWRDTRDPYIIWVSEIIFQQTRISQGIEYFQRFVNTFPDIQSLAQAEEQEVLKLWQGLGYYSRARNMHQAAKKIIEQHHGIFPSQYDEIIALPGIGKYTAAAISSFAFQQVRPVVDGNVIRFISRYKGLGMDFSAEPAKKVLYDILSLWIDSTKPDIFNNALMEFGALYCTTAAPNCENCVFNEECVGFAEKKVAQLPFRPEKATNPILYMHYMVFLRSENPPSLWLHKRNKNAIWKHLFDFPCIESDYFLEKNIIEGSDFFIKMMKGTKYQFSFQIVNVPHKLTHKTLITNFYVYKICAGEPIGKDVFPVEPDSIQKYPFPKVIERFISNLLKVHPMQG